MTKLLWSLKWILKGAIFFTLFAFALNNQQEVSVKFFFGNEWHAPMVLLLLVSFGGGLLVGILGMVPRWWAHRRLARSLQKSQTKAATAATTTPAASVVPDAVDTAHTLYPPHIPPHGI